jgi:disulfide bond formation protein DsbB
MLFHGFASSALIAHFFSQRRAAFAYNAGVLSLKMLPAMKSLCPLLRLSTRPYYFALFALCVGELLFGVHYLQGVLHLEPCPMCILQRCALLGVGLVALIGALHNHGAKIYGWLITLIALAGGGVAVRQSWLQLNPPEIPECGPGLEYLVESLPFTEWLPRLFHGAGDCSVVEWTFLGLSIANWGLVTFVGIVVVTLWTILRRVPSR